MDDRVRRIEAEALAALEPVCDEGSLRARRARSKRTPWM